MKRLATLVALILSAGAGVPSPSAGSGVQRAAARAAPAGIHWKLWLCVHRQEHSAWDDPNEPYYGGLQMSLDFQKSYVPDLLRRYGTADHWPPVVQIWAAEHAYKIEHYSRSWLEGQWPPSVGVCF